MCVLIKEPSYLRMLLFCISFTISIEAQLNRTKHGPRQNNGGCVVFGAFVTL